MVRILTRMTAIEMDGWRFHESLPHVEHALSDPMRHRHSPIPSLAGTIGIDPTVMSAPLMSMLVEATGLIINFTTVGVIRAQI
jgi:predicted TIM-barrel enzyme